MTSQTLVKAAIEKLATERAQFDDGKPVLDLVTISHFDWDHISGLVALMRRFKIRTLLVPYIPLWQRLVIAFSEGVDTQQSFMDFFVDPVSYILNRPGANIDRILFVYDFGDGEPLGTGFDFEPPPDETLRTPPRVDAQKELRHDESPEFEKWRPSGETGGTTVELMLNGESLRVFGDWEFVPYNDAQISPKPNAAFRTAVEHRSAKLMSTGTLQALKELRQSFDRHFGKTSAQRNLASLFLYSGPIRSRVTATTRPLYWGRPETMPYLIGMTPFRQVGNRCSVLYTGDGYLDTKSRLRRLIKYVTKARIDEVACLQVMHHGSRSNWHSGVAKRLRPALSVFSSDPNHKFGHPHGEVLRDFWQYGPVQVNASSSFVFRAMVTF